MALQHLGFIDLPEHVGSGGFDRAAVDGARGRLYVAHTANDAVDVVDLTARRYLGSIPGLTAVAGALVAEDAGRVFTSNRGEDTVGIVTTAEPHEVVKVGVGRRPNGLAYAPGRNRLLVAHVGDPAVAGSCTVSVVDVSTRRRLADIAVAGRTRWTVFDPRAGAFHVNVADPPQIVVVSADDPVAIQRVVTLPHAGPHGLDLDVERRRLFCACDAGVLVELDADTGRVVAEEKIGGGPGLIEVFDTAPLRRREVVTTEPGAHTLAFDAGRQLVCAFLPATHRAAIFTDRP